MTEPNVVDVRLVLDFELLREQKTWLLEQYQAVPSEHNDRIEGILGVIDAIQDQAVEQGVPESVVFGDQNSPDASVVSP